MNSNLYRVHQRVAETKRARRVLLAGGAAPINNPMGGMGMNNETNDAFSVARHIALRTLRITSYADGTRVREIGVLA